MKKKNLFDRLFPTEHDFYDMLTRQAKINAAGVNALGLWMTGSDTDAGTRILKAADDADALRMDMERKLTESFSTPFDRVDIYSISVGMDKVIELSGSTYAAMQEFSVPPNETLKSMAAQLQDGTALFAQSIENLKKHPGDAGQNIAAMRKTHVTINQLYRNGMAALFASGDPMHALKYREAYRDLKDASERLDDAVDILHRIVVRLT